MADLYVNEFESSVILEGSKTPFWNAQTDNLFESSVILEGSKTYEPFTTLAV